MIYFQLRIFLIGTSPAPSSRCSLRQIAMRKKNFFSRRKLGGGSEVGFVSRLRVLINQSVIVRRLCNSRTSAWTHLLIALFATPPHDFVSDRLFLSSLCVDNNTVFSSPTPTAYYLFENFSTPFSFRNLSISCTVHGIKLRLLLQHF